MNNALTVKDLLEFCLKECKNGHADYVFFVTDDEEANGYHALWYPGHAIADYDQADREFMESINHDLSILSNKDKAIYIG